MPHQDFRNRQFGQGTSFSGFDQNQFFGGDFGGGQFGQGSDISSLLAMMGNNKGLFGLGDVATGGLFSAGGAFLGGLGRLLGGKSEQEKFAGESRARAEQVFNLAQNRLGQNVIQPEQFLAEFKRSQAGENQRTAELINRQLGLDVGAAQTDIAAKSQSSIAQFLLQAKLRNAELKSRNDNFLLQLMGSLGGR